MSPTPFATSPCAPHRFPLIDVLAVVAAASVMLLDAAPALGTYLNGLRLAKLTETVAAQVGLAKREAILQNMPVVLCKSGDGATCATAGGWEQGWLIYRDANRNGVLDPDEQVIAKRRALPPAVRFTGYPAAAAYVSFAPTGAAFLEGGGDAAGALTLCRKSASGSEARQIILDAVGTPHIRKLEIASCA